MRNFVRLVLFVVLLGGAACLGSRRTEQGPRWFKGNTHTHTLWSDGDGAPERVVDWYKTHGYSFLVLSDHNILAEGEKWVKVGKEKKQIPPERVDDLVRRYGASWVRLRETDGVKEMQLKTLEEVRAMYEAPGSFLMIKGEEITDEVEKKPVHHNSMNHLHLIKPPGGKTVRECLERTIAAVEEEAKASGRPVLVHLNHPNFHWAVSPDDIAHVKGERYFEVYNGHRGVNNYGDAGHPGTEQIWDYVLALRLGKIGGDVLFGLATDDAHNYYQDQAVANPGRGWIMVRAAALTPEAIVGAMQAGDFYASSGVYLDEVAPDAKGVSLQVAGERGCVYTIRFVGTRKTGPVGVVLQESFGTSARYDFKGDELYVRGVVVSSRRHPNGFSKEDYETAWTQPVVPGK